MKAKAKDAEQSERFIKTARELGADESTDGFERTLKRIVPKKVGKGSFKKPVKKKNNS